MSRAWSVAFWSVIAAAFIGPGTVTTAAAAGARHGTALLWTLAFSTLACLLLQEAAGRLTVVSGRSLGQALREQYPRGPRRVLVLALVLGAIVVGCAAYEAGNIVGGVVGAGLGTGLAPPALTLACGAAAAGLLWRGAPRTIARALSVLVAIMGLAFLATAFRVRPPLAELATGLVRPSWPAGSELLVLGLVGTTVVPYNLFLGSSLARRQRLAELRFGLTVAIVLGGVISMAIVVVGSVVDGPFGFEALADVLTRRLGSWARSLFAAGLFAAGFSSAVTAPLAAALTAQGLLDDGRGRWHDRSPRFRGVWLAVLGTGVAFGLAGVRPIPAIVLAQALNGVLLPLVAVFLLLAVNDRRLMGDAQRNGAVANLALGGVVLVALLLGASHVARAAATAAGLPPPGQRLVVGAAAAAALAGAWPATRAVLRRRRGGPDVEPGSAPGRR